jgi:hypothetical protein
LKSHQLKENSDVRLRRSRQLVIEKREAVAAALRELFEVETSTTAFDYVVTLMSRLAGAA